MRARQADEQGYIEHAGVRIHYEVHGAGRALTLLLLPTWTISHSRLWRAQLAYLARHFRVVTYDGPGNGESDRPLWAAAYAHDSQVEYARKVLDATSTNVAVLVGLSKAANWALELAAEHPARVLGVALIGPYLMLDQPGRSARAAAMFNAPLPDLPLSRVPSGGRDPMAHWAKNNRAYWLEHYEDFLWFFMGQCFPEPYSSRAIEDGVAFGLTTTGDLLSVESEAEWPNRNHIDIWCNRITCPVLLIHGDQDKIAPMACSETIAKQTGGRMVVLEGCGHIPTARHPVQVNQLLHEFVAQFQSEPPSVPARRSTRAKRVLYLSSPIGLGHARRDLAIARELRETRPDVNIEWLAAEPVTGFLERCGEQVHPASRWLANESAHIESEAGEHDLHCFEALRRMDEILVANFMVFNDLVDTERYDLVVCDESWDVDHFLHENPKLKRFSYAWITDFVGNLPMPDGGPREAWLTADYNAEMLDHIANQPQLRDRSIFVGEPDDIVPDRFGPDLPSIREWTEQHYDFAGYVTGFDPRELVDRAALRAELGYRDDEQLCIVTVGGSGVGDSLLRKIIVSFDEAVRRVPGLRMVVIAGPRINPDTLSVPPGLEMRSYVHDLHRHLAASDLAIVQGGLTTCMELTATRTPFVFVPLRHHFEQAFHVPHRLRRYGAGRQLDYADITPDLLADVIATEIGRDVGFRPVQADGAARAASLLTDLI